MLRHEGSYILPDNVPANEFLNLEGNKISTSRNWAVWLHEYLRDFEGKQDVLRYVLTANAPETKDNDFSWKDFQTKNNSELVAIMGNFINRAVVLTHKYFGGNVPQPAEDTDYEKEIRAEIARIKESLESNIENYKFREALKDAMAVSRLGNKYLADTEPWKLIKTDEARTRTILYYSLQLCALSATLAEPFLPFTSAKLFKMLNIERPDWESTTKVDLIPVGHKIGEAELLFERIEDAAIDAQLQRLENIKIENEKNNYKPQPVKENVAFDDFMKVDIRVGTVLECFKVPKADKLLQFKIDDGMGGRTIVSGIAKYYTEPEKLVGTQVCFIANFEPRKLKGVVSEGMILSAEDADGRLVLLQPKDLVKCGVRVG